MEHGPQTKYWAFVLIIFTSLLTSAAILFLKAGADRLPLIFFNWHLAIGLVLYGIGFLMLLVAFRHGEVSILYPAFSMGFVWVALVAAVVFKEALTVMKLIGIGGVIVGIVLLGLAARQSKVIPA